MTEKFLARKAIESLRAGVPNLAAVRALGTDHAEIVSAFERNWAVATGRSENDGRPRGFLIEGNFGSGKSHALRHLQTIAESKGMAFSTVAISKETQLGDLTAVFRAAVSSLTFGDARLNGTLAEIFEGLVRDEKTYSKLCATAVDPKYRFDSTFAAALELLRRYRAAPEIVEQLYDFFDGGQPHIVRWKNWLKEVDGFRLSLKAFRAQDLARQRFRFVSLVLRAAGFEGWFVALDEVELIANFSRQARFKAYESIAFLFEPAGHDDSLRRWFVVCAITEDLGSVLFDDRRDHIALAEKVGMDDRFRANARAGIAILRQSECTYRLVEPTDRVLLDAHERIRKLYANAYEVPVDPFFDGSAIRARSKSMRSYIREWIAHWDLTMQDRAYRPSISSRETKFSTDEDEDLEAV